MHTLYDDTLHSIAGKIMQSPSNDDIGLLSGLSGETLFLYKYGSQFKSAEALYAAKQKIDKVFENISNGKSNSMTHTSGLAGVGWLVEYLLSQRIFTEEDGDIMEEADEVLGHFMVTQMKQGYYDFLHNAGGIALYFVRRAIKTPLAIPLLEKYIEALIATANEENGMLSWETVIDIEKQTRGSNISLSHGSSSIVMLLAKLQPLFQSEEMEDMIERTLSYILHQQYPKGINAISMFPCSSLQHDFSNTGSRLAWCYGDLGIAMACYQAGEVSQRQDWTDKALEILLYAAIERRDLAKNMVIDAGLCHGTAGIGHIFYRMWWNTKRQEFKEAADYWFNETLKMAKFEDGLAGYKVYHGEKYGGWVNKYDLLEGIAGVGLALLTYTYDLDPSWDECLLLS